MTKKRLYRVCCLAAALLLCLGMLAGCGTKSGGTFTLGTSTQLDTLNPLSGYAMSSFELYLLVYDPLVRYDQNWEPEPCLAESWTVSGDNLSWTFELNEKARWHDGRPFTSADVKFTFDTVLETGLGYMYSASLAGIAEVSCPDEHTVVVRTDYPKANMLDIMMPILPKHLWEGIPADELENTPNTGAVGTGPFKLESAGADGAISLARNADYFGAVPKVEKLVFKAYENPDALAQALMVGEVDAATGLAEPQLAQLQTDSALTVVSGEVPGFTQLGINCWDDPASGGSPLLLDVAVRQAIEYAIDRQKIVTEIYHGNGTPADVLVNPGNEYHHQVENLRSFDPAAGAALLEAAGYTDTDGDGVREKDGVPMRFELACIADNAEEQRAGQVIAAGCAEIGIGIDLVSIDRDTLQDKTIAYDYDLFIWGWGADVEPTSILSLLLTRNIGGTNEPGWSNPQYDALFDTMVAEMDEAARKQVAGEMQQLAYDEAPYILLLYDNSLQAWRSGSWTGLEQIPPERGVYFYANTAYNYLHLAKK